MQFQKLNDDANAVVDGSCLIAYGIEVPHETEAVVAAYILQMEPAAMISKTVQGRPIFIVGLLLSLRRLDVLQIRIDGLRNEGLAFNILIRSALIGGRCLLVPWL